LVSESRTRYIERVESGREKKAPFLFDKVSFTSRNSFRKFPLLTGLHRATDGALVGVLVAVSMMSAVALHSQHLWSLSFSKLEITRGLTQRLLESTAVLENYLLKTSSLPDYMEPTETRDLIYLARPENSIVNGIDTKISGKDLLKKFSSYPITNGY